MMTEQRMAVMKKKKLPAKLVFCWKFTLFYLISMLFVLVINENEQAPQNV